MALINNNTSLERVNEIDLKKILISLKDRFLLVSGFTSFITVIGLIFALNIQPIYISTAEIIGPNNATVNIINSGSKIIGLNNETNIIEPGTNINAIATSETLLYAFINNALAQSLQKKVFVEGDYLKKLIPANELIEDSDIYFLNFIKSLNIEPPKEKKENELIQGSYLFSLQGDNPEIIALYLNELIAAANLKTINNISTLNKQIIETTLALIIRERESLLSLLKNVRLSEIERIKEIDDEKIRDINDSIDRERKKEYQDRKNQITKLNDAAEIAKSLGITENNFKNLNNLNSNNTSISVEVQQEYPLWYLYGETALRKRVEMLENRENDDAYIEDLLNKKVALFSVQKNNRLQTLIQRKDDKHFNKRIIELGVLEKEAISVNKLNTGFSNLQVIELRKDVASYPLDQGKRSIVIFSFTIGLLLSIFLALLLGASKPDEKILTK